MDKKTCGAFIGKHVGIERVVVINGNDNFSERIFFSKGLLLSVTDTDVLIEFNSELQAFALDSIKSIREVTL